MRIATYCITFPEEHDILPNMIGQAKKLGDVWLVDGGPNGHLCHHPRDLDDDVVMKLAADMGCIYTRLWWPGNPGTQRNRALEAMAPYGYDWIVMNDSDEMWSDEAVRCIPSLLESVPLEVTNLRVRWLTLVGDEDHYSTNYSQVLVHGRIHRPGTVWWGETWHEHQFHQGERIDTQFYLLHLQCLFLERLQRMRGHGPEAWKNMDRTPGARNLATWPDIFYPDTG